MPAVHNNPKSGAGNLLENCLGVKSGDTVLLVLEPDDSLYDPEPGRLLARCLDELGALTTISSPTLIADPAEFPTDVAACMQDSDHTIFLSRIGDYVRFVPLPGSGRKATSYALNKQMLGSPYATIDNRLMVELQNKLERELLQAGGWQVECPLGTNIHGQFDWPSSSGGVNEDLTVTLFPVSTFIPVPCHTATGEVALSRWLMPGGAARLDNAELTLDSVVVAQVCDGKLGSFRGTITDVARLNKHYDYVSQTLGINRNRIHSWHAGINPQTRFDQSADDHLDRWSAISFGSPKYLHFHTCGDEPPGEVAWSVFNPTITIDGIRYWENGEFVWLQRPDNKSLIESYKGAGHLLDPSQPIGID